MSRPDRLRMLDIIAACEAIELYWTRAAADEMAFDAIRVRLIEIGEAVKDIDPIVLGQEPSIRWTEISRMRDHLTHRYFDTAHSIVRMTVERDVPELEAAIRRLLPTLDE